MLRHLRGPNPQRVGVGPSARGGVVPQHEVAVKVCPHPGHELCQVGQVGAAGCVGAITALPGSGGGDLVGGPSQTPPDAGTRQGGEHLRRDEQRDTHPRDLEVESQEVLPDGEVARHDDSDADDPVATHDPPATGADLDASSALVPTCGRDERRGLEPLRHPPRHAPASTGAHRDDAGQRPPLDAVCLQREAHLAVRRGRHAEGLEDQPHALLRHRRPGWPDGAHAVRRRQLRQQGRGGIGCHNTPFESMGTGGRQFRTAVGHPDGDAAHTSRSGRRAEFVIGPPPWSQWSP